jgi:hypothetical protein
MWLQTFGYGLGFADFNDWSIWCPDVGAPTSVMNTGSALGVTEWDGYMLRHTWDRLKDRYL